MIINQEFNIESNILEISNNDQLLNTETIGTNKTKIKVKEHRNYKYTVDKTLYVICKVI